MALRDSISIELANDLRTLGAALDQAGKGHSGPLIEAFMQRYGWTDSNKVYRHLKAVGWTSGRKRRADAGKTALDMETVEKLGATLRAGVRENGKATMETPNAISLLTQNGVDIPLSASRVRTILKRHHHDVSAARQRAPHTAMRSLHPNHVHFVDPSLCLLYYTPNGQQRVLHDSEIHRNKPAWVEKTGHLKCWRYVLTDDDSGTLIVRYYAAKGENQANLYDFLLYAWQHMPSIGRPFHGVSSLLVWDKGSASLATAINNALSALDVKTWAHAKGHSWAKGQVENGNNLVEKLFESRLIFQPVKSVDELNQAAERWYQAFNANAIPRLDTRIRRPGMEPTARYALWQTIRADQLRRLPDLELCRYLLSAAPEPRVVRSTPAGGLSIQFAHPQSKRTEYYDLSRVPGVFKDMKVEVSPLIYGDAQVLIRVEDYKGDIQTHVVDPVQWTDRGKRADAPAWGERFRDTPDTAIEEANKAADRAAYGDLPREEIDKAKAKRKTPFGGSLDAHSHLADVYIPAYMARPGTDLEVRNPVEVVERRLDLTTLCIKLKPMLGDAWPEGAFTKIQAAYPEGAPESELPALAEWLRAESQPVAERPRLVAVK
jgi:hypothetical protein